MHKHALHIKMLFKLLMKDNNGSTWVQCVYMTLKIQYQSRKMWSIGGSWIWTEHKIAIRSSSAKKQGICLNVLLMLSRYLQSLTNTYQAVEEEKNDQSFL